MIHIENLPECTEPSNDCTYMPETLHRRYGTRSARVTDSHYQELFSVYRSHGANLLGI